MLVVFAVLGILISLIQPSLKKITSKSDQIQCLKQLGEVFITLMFYVEDNAGYYPASNPIYRRHVPTLWDKAMLYDPLTVSYNLRIESLICPSGQKKPGWIRSGYWGGDVGMGYAYLAGIKEARVGKFFEPNPMVADLQSVLNGPRDVVIADVNMSFSDRDLSSSNHSNLDATTLRKSSVSTMLKAMQGGNRFTHDGSGRWVELSEMGRGDQQPDPTDITTAKYSHWRLIRPYYW